MYFGVPVASVGRRSAPSGCGSIVSGTPLGLRATEIPPRNYSLLLIDPGRVALENS